MLHKLGLIGLSLIFLAVAACESEQAPPPMPVHVHHPRVSALFFETGSAVPEASSIRVLDREISEGFWAKHAFDPRTTGKVCVLGNTDKFGPEAENIRLSQRRAEWVANYLIKAGMPKERLVVRGRGSSSLLVPTPANKPEPLNRNVLVEWTSCPPS